VDCPFDDELYFSILQEKIKGSKKKETAGDAVLNTSGTY